MPCPELNVPHDDADEDGFTRHEKRSQSRTGSYGWSLGDALWIGLSDEAQEDTWIWDSGEAIAYRNWGVYEPNGGRHENYAEMRHDGLWNSNGKRALLPGETASFVNYTSYGRGLNGVIVDVGNLAGTPTASDFVFMVGNSDDPSTWATAPAPQSITVRPGAGVDGSDRVTVVWADDDPYTPDREPGSISNQWLQVTLLATPNTGLAEPDVFYFGNAVGESGNSTNETNVDTNDEIGARNHPHSLFDPAPIEDAYDYDRDKRVDTNDEILARNNPTSAFSRLQLITVPAESGGSRAEAEDSGSVELSSLEIGSNDAAPAAVVGQTRGTNEPTSQPGLTISEGKGGTLGSDFVPRTQIDGGSELPADVNRDKLVSRSDAQELIDALNTHGSVELPPMPTGSLAALAHVDVNNDGMLTPLDVLIVVNQLNTHSQASAEGEANSSVHRWRETASQNTDVTDLVFANSADGISVETDMVADTCCSSGIRASFDLPSPIGGVQREWTNPRAIDLDAGLTLLDSILSDAVEGLCQLIED